MEFVLHIYFCLATKHAHGNWTNTVRFEVNHYAT